jgi:spermidine synthase
MVWFFTLFLVSGFCSILYEILWLRLAMAQFGVTTALTSIVISMFMAGLGLGSWGSGRLILRYENSIRSRALRFYALVELLIGISALLVPYQLLLGRRLLEWTAVSSSWSYYLGSGVCIALTMIPWCACMGATIPFAMLAIRSSGTERTERSFSYLYLANVLGAVVGAIVPLLLVELYGFRGTLKIGAACNVLLALSALVLSTQRKADGQKAAVQAEASRKEVADYVSTHGTAKPLVLLFLTGLTSMGMEVVWIRQFTPYLGTVVYAFAAILAGYLVATFTGLEVYRVWSQRTREEGRWIWILLGLFALLPLAAADPRFHQRALFRLALGIAPFSAALGFITPMLVDRWSGGDPGRAGKAYAVNVLGCILGPLVSGFLLLPLLDERWVLFLFSLPWLLVGISQEWLAQRARPRLDWQTAAFFAAVLVALGLLLTQKSFEDQFANSEVLRDNTATIVATGAGRDKDLVINGVGITGLTPITKFMAHLPLAFLDRPPKNALVVCFGMGTTFRSLRSWGIAVTGVELVPSVPQVFGFYHPDGPELMRSPLSRVVIDDGRRYLERTSGQYDVITIDPPPPAQAAGSSLLYSKEFYTIIRRRLRPGGILQQWLPGAGGDAMVHAAVARALRESFPYVRVFHSVEGWGYHFLATDHPLPKLTGAELTQRLPAKAAADLVEWGPQRTPESQFNDLLGRELSTDEMIGEAPNAPALQDDRPVNEYYAIRRRAYRRLL